MPCNDFTSEFLEIKDIIVSNVQSTNTEIHVHFTLKRRDIRCPHCGSITNKVHDYRTSLIKDVPIMGKLTVLHYKKRRYHCDCCNHHFYEPFSHIPKQGRITTRLAFYSFNMLREAQSVAAVSRQIGISPSSIFRRLSDVNYPKPRNLPKVLSIDEFKGNAGGQKFQAILTDPSKRKVIDILPSRSQYRLQEYIKSFPNRKNVRFFVMDMNTVYRDIAQTFLPNAKIVIDKFHVVRYASWALENVRKRIQHQMHPSKRKYFKRSRKILLSRFKNLKQESRDQLEVMLQQSYDLAKAYYLKEQFYDFIASKSRYEATQKLKKFILSAEVSHLEEFNPCLTMLRNWQKYILNAFDCPYTNGFTEGTNNKIKVIKRNAYGYRNFKNFRNRIFLTAS